jgi:hypothetical protein
MSALSLVIPLVFSFFVQFLLWFNLLFPYNVLFENFNRILYMVFSISGFFAASISIVFCRIIAFNNVNKKALIMAIIFQFLCFISCAFFFVSGLTGWLLF